MVRRKPLRVLAVLLDHLVLRFPLRLSVFSLRLLLFLFGLPISARLGPWTVAGERRDAAANTQNTQQDQRGKSSHSLSLQLILQQATAADEQSLTTKDTKVHEGNYAIESPSWSSRFMPVTLPNHEMSAASCALYHTNGTIRNLMRSQYSA